MIFRKRGESSRFQSILFRPQAALIASSISHLFTFVVVTTTMPQRYILKETCPVKDIDPLHFEINLNSNLRQNFYDERINLVLV